MLKFKMLKDYVYINYILSNYPLILRQKQFIFHELIFFQIIPLYFLLQYIT